MTESLLNKFESFYRLVAPSVGGAVLVLIGFDIGYKKGNLFTPKAVEILLFVSLLTFVLYVLKFREKKILLILLTVTASLSFAYADYRAYSQYAYFVAIFCGLASLLYAVWFEKENMAVFLLLSGALSGVVFSYANFLFLLKPMNFVILMGMVLSFLVAKKAFRKEKSMAAYNYLYFFVVIPSLCFVLMGYFKHFLLFYAIMYLVVLVGWGLKNAREN